MRFLAHLPALLLGLLFILFGLNFFYSFLPVPRPPEGSAAAAFIGAMVQSGFFAFIKILEIVGGVLLLLPFTRRYGLLLLGPIIVNIFAYQYFFIGQNGLLQPPVLAVGILGLLALWFERHPFLRFIR